MAYRSYGYDLLSHPDPPRTLLKPKPLPLVCLAEQGVR